MDVPAGERCLMNLLQIRPIIDSPDNRPIDWAGIDPGETLIYAESALGVGRMEGITEIVYVKPESFDKLRTERIADELLELNRRMRDEGLSYVLVGPGRWGTSIPTLGIPVKWSHISEAKVIVECGIEGFHVDPSQGTHFFQNVTSLGVGYLNVAPTAARGVSTSSA